jgi:hypothetical protein
LRKSLAVALIALAVALVAPLAAPSPASAAPTNVCSPHNNNTTNSVTCNIRDTAYRYYWAYLSQNAGDPTNPFQGRVSIKVQVLARRAVTGVVVAGLWIVYESGPRQYLRAKFDAWDGNGASRNGLWNYEGKYNPDGAARGGGADIIRYPRVSPSAPVGLVWGRNRVANFKFHLTVNNGGCCPAYLDAQPLYIVFRP